MEENTNETPVPYVVHESALARMERTIHKLWVLAILLIVLLVATNAGWLWYESQFEDVTITAEQTADGQSNNYAVGGDFIGGSAESDDQTPNP